MLDVECWTLDVLPFLKRTRILMITPEGPPLSRATALVDVSAEARRVGREVKNREEALEWVRKEYSSGEDEGKRPTSNLQRRTRRMRSNGFSEIGRWTLSVGRWTFCLS